jgi:hypothetical protein
MNGKREGKKDSKQKTPTEYMKEMFALKHALVLPGRRSPRLVIMPGNSILLSLPWPKGNR